MATKVIKYDNFKRGDTPLFAFTFTAPYVGFNWVGVTADAAITAVDAPTNNSGAAVVRLDQALAVNDDGSAITSIQPTVAESKALKPNTGYKVELQLKDNSGTNVATAVTGTVYVEQDYII